MVIKAFVNPNYKSPDHLASSLGRMSLVLLLGFSLILLTQLPLKLKSQNLVRRLQYPVSIVIYCDNHTLTEHLSFFFSLFQFFSHSDFDIFTKMILFSLLDVLPHDSLSLFFSVVEDELEEAEWDGMLTFDKFIKIFRLFSSFGSSCENRKKNLLSGCAITVTWIIGL